MNENRDSSTSSNQKSDPMKSWRCKIEAYLNSRPLYAFSNDPSNLSAIIPSHFLIGESPVSILALAESEEKPSKEYTAFSIS